MAVQNVTPTKAFVPLASDLVANRREYFRLVESMEAEIGRPVDEMELQARIDSELSDRDNVSEREALWLLRTPSPLRLVRGE